jgi:hypothetical protein
MIAPSKVLSRQMQDRPINLLYRHFVHAFTVHREF